jgi:predicted HTH transcriptional regulator
MKQEEYDKILKIIRTAPGISGRSISEALGLKNRDIHKYLIEMQELGEIIKIGATNNSTWWPRRMSSAA